MSYFTAKLKCRYNVIQCACISLENALYIYIWVTTVTILKVMLSYWVLLFRQILFNKVITVHRPATVPCWWHSLAEQVVFPGEAVESLGWWDSLYLAALGAWWHCLNDFSTEQGNTKQSYKLTTNKK